VGRLYAGEASLSHTSPCGALDPILFWVVFHGPQRAEKHIASLSPWRLVPNPVLGFVSWRASRGKTFI